MRSRWKDFLYFSTRDRIACIGLVLILLLFIVIYILCSDLIKVTPAQLKEQEIIRSEFVEYESSLEQKEIISDELSYNLTEEQEENGNNQQSTNYKRTTKKQNKLTPDQTIDVNSANENLLIKVPGIGKATAIKIIEYRNVLGGFYNLEQLHEIQGISSSRFISILPYLTLKKKQKVISFYKSDLVLLSNHPYISEEQLKLLTDMKDKKRLNTIDDLTEFYQFKQSDIDRLRPYLDFSK